ncbi:hypothetical protein GCM10027261_14430 [Geodermatophilus arenarius]|uniref:Uncharacterized protein n=1 Tax=Geodermatophilus arenarius TaxID=1137990 RepID=A0ABV9LIF9_9ACTN
MSAATRRRAATTLPTGLSTAERLVYGYLAAFVTVRKGVPVDPPTLAAHVCLPADVTAAAVEALLARRLLRRQPDGRVLVLGAPGSGP